MPFPDGVLRPLPLAIGGVLVPGPSPDVRGSVVDCCFAKEDSVAGDGTAAAESSEIPAEAKHEDSGG